VNQVISEEVQQQLRAAMSGLVARSDSLYAHLPFDLQRGHLHRLADELVGTVLERLATAEDGLSHAERTEVRVVLAEFVHALVEETLAQVSRRAAISRVHERIRAAYPTASGVDAAARVLMGAIQTNRNVRGKPGR
jgi:regulator of sirC expression with transglutaminase-like and TPR domain